MSETIEKARFLAVILILGLLSTKGTFGQAPAPHPSGHTATHTGSKPTASATTLSEARKNSIMKYVRGRFGVPDAVKLTFAEVKPSLVSPGLFDAVMMVDDGKNPPHPQELLVSRDGRFLFVVTVAVIDIQQDTPAEMVKRIQEVFKTPPEVKMSVGPFKPSASLEFKQATLTIDNGKSKQDRTVLLARDGKHIVVSDLYNMTLDPRQQALRNISLHDEPSVGPANAPVTIVEYADLQCPTCARMHEFLETKVVPRYGNKLRVVFKEYPLPMHDWSFTAAIADQCAYEINPSTYVPLRTMIFRNQQLINIANLRETLLSYGEQAGLDRVQLAGCLDCQSVTSPHSARPGRGQTPGCQLHADVVYQRQNDGGPALRRRVLSSHR